MSQVQLYQTIWQLNVCVILFYCVSTGTVSRFWSDKPSTEDWTLDAGHTYNPAHSANTMRTISVWYRIPSELNGRGMAEALLHGCQTIVDQFVIGCSEENLKTLIARNGSSNVELYYFSVHGELMCVRGSTTTVASFNAHRKHWASEATLFLFMWANGRKNACVQNVTIPPCVRRSNAVCCVSNSSVCSIRWSFLWHFNIRLFHLAFNVCAQQQNGKGKTRTNEDVQEECSAVSGSNGSCRFFCQFAEMQRTADEVDEIRDIGHREVNRKETRNEIPISRMFENLDNNFNSAPASSEIIVSRVIYFPRHAETNGKVDGRNFISFRQSRRRCGFSYPKKRQKRRMPYRFGGFLQTLSISPPCNYRGWSWSGTLAQQVVSSTGR